jgi:NADH-quinone oxidoreductase subunit J
MTAMQLIFFLTALVTLAAAFLVVTTRNLVHSALWLILTLFGVGVFYVLLNAGFFAVVQVVVYIGAIAILFIFAAMLTRRMMQDSGPQINRGWWIGVLVGIVLFAGITTVLLAWPGITINQPEISDASAIISRLGQALVSPDGYLIPFELASVLLVAAMIGAIYVSLEKKK